GSMIPTLLVGDFIFVNKMSYGLRIPFTDPAKVHKLWEQPPKRGDVVVFINPHRPDTDYVKRVVGLPGDHIEIRDGHKHPILVRKDSVFQKSGSFVVEEGRVFMMGDNRDNSQDSR